MKIGFYGFNAGLLHRPEAMVRVLRTAEDAGLESVWSAEHVVLVDPQRAPSPAPPTAPFLGTIAALAFATASTTRLKVGSGVVLIPQREPIVLAKELAGVDVLSNGRLLVGVGVGYVPGEYDALGIPFEERGARASEHIEVLRALWTEDAPTFDGRFSRFAGIQSRPRPVQEPHPPIHVGGSSPAALRRAVRQGDGWYGFLPGVARGPGRTALDRCPSTSVRSRRSARTWNDSARLRRECPPWPTREGGRRRDTLGDGRHFGVGRHGDDSAGTCFARRPGPHRPATPRPSRSRR